VDIGTTDVPAATAFYSGIFGWTVEDLGPQAGGYGLIRQGGRQVAGIGPATDPDRGTSWSLYFATDNADETATKVESNGGKVIVAPMDVMDQGRMAVFMDPAGAFFSVWQPGLHRGSEIVGEHGSLTWAELVTSDLATVKSFYQAVFGFSTRDVVVGESMTYTLFQLGGKTVAGAMAIGPAAGDTASQWSIYFAVDDCDAVADKAIELGATELLRDDSPAGRLATLIDPQGGRFSIIRNDPDFAL